MADRSRWLSLISRLLQATQENEISWHADSTGATIGRGGERPGTAYTTTFLDRMFRIYPYQYKGSHDGEKFYWIDDVRLEFITPSGSVEYTVPEIEGLKDLLQAVQYRSADIDGFLRKLPA